MLKYFLTCHAKDPMSDNDKTWLKTGFILYDSFCQHSNKVTANFDFTSIKFLESIFRENDF